MAALKDVPLYDIVELPALTAADLDPLLHEEILEWDRRFCWDFRPSADLLRRFLQMNSLFGYAFRVNREIIGYSYYVCEARKGLIGDFYVRKQHKTSSTEMVLLGAVVQALIRTPGIRRIESQLLLLQDSLSMPPFADLLTRHDRLFMAIDEQNALRLQPVSPSLNVSFVLWADRYHEEAAHLVSAAYRGHVDSEINDQYRTI